MLVANIKKKRKATKTSEKTRISRICDGVESETRKSKASFKMIQVSPKALSGMRLE